MRVIPMKPCRHRTPTNYGRYRCDLIDRALGWHHGNHPSVCETCNSDPVANYAYLNSRINHLTRGVYLTIERAPMDVALTYIRRHSTIRDRFPLMWWASKKWIIPYLLAILSTFFIGEAPPIVTAYRLATCLRCPHRVVGLNGYSYCQGCGCGQRKRARLDGPGRTKLKHWYVKCPYDRFHPYRAIVPYTKHTARYI